VWSLLIFLLSWLIFDSKKHATEKIPIFYRLNSTSCLVKFYKPQQPLSGLGRAFTNLFNCVEAVGMMLGYTESITIKFNLAAHM
jgi:hypothetical protein